MSEDIVQLFINDKEVSAPKGAMLIEVTDQHNIDVPRFCYHKNYRSLPTAACVWWK